jgi:alginate O-acetyltransferase complex protein AlgI
MWFNSLDFLVFMLAVLPVFYLLGLIRSGQGTPRIVFLVAASCLFYMWWNPLYIILLFISMALDYTYGLLFQKFPKSKWRLLVAVSVIGSLTILSIFKYGKLFYVTATPLLAYLGIHIPTWREEWTFVLPAGVSFYTFQTMSYCIDIYRGKAETESSFYRFALFVTFFPQLVAGPIGKARDLLPQYRDMSRNRPIDLTGAVEQIAAGLFKKVAVADTLAMLIEPIFRNPGNYSGGMVLTACIFFSIQIYCDFSGYTDIAIGIAKLFGVQLSLNFFFPYFTKNIQDFWRCWHISLSSWLREYLYISLGGNRKGKVRTYINLMITMLLGGLWHGASWNFMLWGGLHGIYLAIHRLFHDLLPAKEKLPALAPRWVARPIGLLAGLTQAGFVSVPLVVFLGLFNFALVTLTWIPFRCTAFGDTMTCLKQIFTWADVSAAATHIDGTGLMSCWLLIAILLGFDVYFRLRAQYWEQRTWATTVKPFFAIIFVLLTIVFAAPQAQQFIYFQF